MSPPKIVVDMDWDWDWCRDHADKIEAGGSLGEGYMGTPDRAFLLTLSERAVGHYYGWEFNKRLGTDAFDFRVDGNNIDVKSGWTHLWKFPFPPSLQVDSNKVTGIPRRCMDMYILTAIDVDAKSVTIMGQAKWDQVVAQPLILGKKSGRWFHRVFNKDLHPIPWEKTNG